MRSSRRNSTASVTSATSITQTSEMFSGAGSEIIPSSISSLHYPHRFARPTENSPLLQAALDVDLRSVRSGVSAESDTANFRFFSADEIESAQGGSTLENAEFPVDYNTDWEYNIDKYGEDEPRDAASLASSASTSHYSHFRDRRDSNDSTESLLPSPRELPNFAAKLQYQRFYLAEEDLVIGIAGYAHCWWKKAVFIAICVATFGMAYVVLRWFPRYRANLMGTPCPLGNADWVVVENERGELTTVPVASVRWNEPLSSYLPLHEGEKDPIAPYLSSFVYRYTKFFYDPTEDLFRTNSLWYDRRWLSLHEAKAGISYRTHEQRQQVFGENTIEIEDKSIASLLVDEVLHPFYVFQVFSVLLWLADDYYYYALCILVISVVSIANSLVETRRTIRRLQQMSRFTCEVRVWRQGFWKQTDSRDLVPGDVFEVEATLATLPCDALLLNGECVVNESMLTGESVPVTKSAATHETVQSLPDSFVSPQLLRSYLYNGTGLLRSRADEPVCAMVLKTGFSTTKGALVRLMLFPKPTDFKFYEDSFKYIGFMTMIAFVGFTYSTYNFLKLGLPVRLIVLRALDIITIVVPPALPATLTIGSTFAISRLKKMQIFCVAPTKVNVGGKLDVVCFDKTGTLTQDGLDVLGVHVSRNAPGRRGFLFGPLVDDTGVAAFGNVFGEVGDAHESHNERHLLSGMACCHSIRVIDGDLMGDPLDVKMFGFSGWNIDEIGGKTVVTGPSGPTSAPAFTIEHEYEFVSNLRRMSVIATASGAAGAGERYIFTKGAPEVMTDICDPLTLPTDYEDVLYGYTHRGFRVIACAYKRERERKRRNQPHDATGVPPRTSAEADLVFAGFIVFENKLKESTTSTLQELNRAEIRTIMCTGDNILTAVSVARECELVPPSVQEIYTPIFNEGILEWVSMDGEKKLDPTSLTPTNGLGESYRLAVTGDVFRYLLTELKNDAVTCAVLMRCDIFARMSPDEKHELVERLQALDYTVGFCGDGANDCGALKAADVGISLLEAEASVAAPFTSRVFEITCVLDVIREGRSSLVTSFSCFKYMSLYSAIQFITVTILYKRGVNLGDFQFLYIDMFLILPLAIFMSWSKPFEKLSIKRPTANLVSPKVLVPLICHIATLALFQVVLWLMVQRQPWYIKPIPGSDDAVQSSDNTVLFLFSNFQYILIAVVLSSGPPYRESMSKNMPFMVNLAVSTALSMLLFAVSADSWMGELMQLTDMGAGFYVLMVVAAVLNLVVMVIGEERIFTKFARALKRLVKKGGSKKAWKNLRSEFSRVEVV